MRNLLLILCFALAPYLVMGQRYSTRECPDWVNGYYKDCKNSYIEVISAVGYSEDNAREKAIQRVAEQRSLATGQRVQLDSYSGDMVIKGRDELTVKCRIVDEYREYLAPGEYRVSLLVQTVKNPTFNYEPVSVSDKYPFSARVFVPGMAQLHKGSTTKGVLFIAGEVVAIGGIVAFEGLRASYASKINQTHNTSSRTQYINKERNMKNVRNGFIAGAAVVYVWNIIDGLVAKGKQHIEVGEAHVAITPVAAPEMSGVMLSMTF